MYVKRKLAVGDLMPVIQIIKKLELKISKSVLQVLIFRASSPTKIQRKKIWLRRRRMKHRKLLERKARLKKLDFQLHWMLWTYY